MCRSRTHATVTLFLFLLLLLKTSRSKSAHAKRNAAKATTFVPSDEQRLFRKLMRNYEKSVRPVINATTAVPVKLGITLTQIFKLDEKNQVLTVNVWLDQEWMDEKMRWNPDKYGGIKTLRIPCQHIWLPDIVLYNSVDDYTMGYMKSLAMVSHEGNVFWPPIVRFRSSCKVDITYFPFDDQVCHMKLGSWAYDGFQVDVLNRSSNIDLSNYIDNGEWELMEVRAQRRVVVYSCCPEPFPDVTFYIHIRRRTTYYTFNVIIPCVILSILTIAGFFLPAESGEKVTLGLTVLLAFSVFMLLIAESMPATSEFVPLIGIYLTVTMAMTSMSVIFSVFVLHVHHRGSLCRRAPSWLRCFAIALSRVVCHNATPLLSSKMAPLTRDQMPAGASCGSRSGSGLGGSGFCSGGGRAGSSAGSGPRRRTTMRAGYGSFNQGFRLSSLRNVTLMAMENGEYSIQLMDSPAMAGPCASNQTSSSKATNKGIHKDVNKDVKNEAKSINKDINKSVNNDIKDASKRAKKDINIDVNKGINKDVSNEANGSNGVSKEAGTLPGQSAESSGSGKCSDQRATYRRIRQVEADMIYQLHAIIACYEREESELRVNREWADIAIVFDRALFWFMFALATSVTLGLLIFKPLTKSVSIDDYL